MRSKLIVGLCASILAVGVSFVTWPVGKTMANADQVEQQSEKVNVDLDEKSAVQIAEIVLVRVYGERVRKEKPWKVVSRNATVFQIEGTFHGDDQTKGGVAMITIGRTNGAVVNITHGK